ncbi:hypothetical protein BKA82DRAFT_4015578 [Pisolithus tinctorius]|nr:hypothetical protein BKA82DRAFT_4015578 [Pisolithus tinctorius]
MSRPTLTNSNAKQGLESGSEASLTQKSRTLTGGVVAGTKFAGTKVERSEGVGFSLCTTPLHNLSPRISEGEYRWRVGDNSNRQKSEAEGVGTKLIFVLKNSGV